LRGRSKKLWTGASTSSIIPSFAEHPLRQLRASQLWFGVRTPELNVVWGRRLHPSGFSRHLRFIRGEREILLFGGLDAIVTFDTHLPLNERLLRIDHIQARRYSKLAGIALEIATEGIVRHLKACDRMDVNPETSAVREIIDDALNGRRVFAETEQHPQAA
jgi:hypothetical protein